MKDPPVCQRGCCGEHCREMRIPHLLYTFCAVTWLGLASCRCDVTPCVRQTFPAHRVLIAYTNNTTVTTCEQVNKLLLTLKLIPQSQPTKPLIQEPFTPIVAVRTLTAQRSSRDPSFRDHDMGSAWGYWMDSKDLNHSCDRPHADPGIQKFGVRETHITGDRTIIKLSGPTLLQGAIPENGFTHVSDLWPRDGTSLFPTFNRSGLV